MVVIVVVVSRTDPGWGVDNLIFVGDVDYEYTSGRNREGQMFFLV